MKARLFGAIAAASALVLALVLAPARSADQSTKAAHIAFLTAESAPVSLKPFSAFRERMRELGWAEGDNLFFDSHWEDGHTDRLPDLTREALPRNPDVTRDRQHSRRDSREERNAHRSYRGRHG